MGFFNEYPYRNLTDLNLDWILKHFGQFVADIKELKEWQTTHEKEYQELLVAWESFVAGNWSPELTATMNKWAAENLKDIIGELMTKTVYFEITNSGNFVAYIPESWSEITFNTTEFDYSTPLQPQYGHLVLSY